MGGSKFFTLHSSLFTYFMEETREGGDVFEGGGELETGVQVDACALRMIISLYALCIIRTYATTEQEGRHTMIAIEDAPVELLSAAPWERCLSIEEEIIDNTLVGLGGL